MKAIGGKGIIMIMGVLALLIVEYFVFRMYPQYEDFLKYLIPAFFIIMSILFLMYVNKIKRKKYTPRKEISILMIFNIVPLLLSLTFILLYVMLVNKDNTLFLIIFAIHYAWFLTMKSVILYKIDPKKK
jgi:hypothetical protein